MRDKHPPVLMRRIEAISLKEAIHRSGKSESTVRRLCRKYGVARQTTAASPLEISSVGLEMVLHGDLDALEMLRAGDRTSPAVARYFSFLGLPL